MRQLVHEWYMLDAIDKDMLPEGHDIDVDAFEHDVDSIMSIYWLSIDDTAIRQCLYHDLHMLHGAL